LARVRVAEPAAAELLARGIQPSQQRLILSGSVPDL
jgi:hypothetical protein